jgi:hypothetical protein
MTSFCMIFSLQKPSFLKFYPKNSLIPNFHNHYSFISEVRSRILSLQSKFK